MEPEQRRRSRKVYNDPGHAHSLTFSCYHRYRFLESERACLWLADAICEARAKYEFQLWAYVFMPDHAHLIVWPQRQPYDISTILKAIKNPVGRKAAAHLRKHAAHWLERIAVKHGNRTEYRFWEAGGGYDRNLIEPRTLMATINYIHLNPTRKELVTRASEWKWSSAGWFEGHELNCLKPDPIPPEWLMD